MSDPISYDITSSGMPGPAGPKGGGRDIYATWATLSAITGVAANTTAEVPLTDTGTHTDPVVGGTVSNSGVYSYSLSPAGWRRMADVDALSAKPFADAAAASAASIAGVAKVGTTLSTNILEFTGRLGSIFAYVTTGMQWNIVDVRSKLGYWVGALGRRITDSFDPRVVLMLTDSARNVFAEIGLDGVKAKNASFTNLNGAKASTIQQLFGTSALIFGTATRYYVPTYGQSLARGGGATSSPTSDSGAIALTTDQPYGNLMFHGGVRPDDINGVASLNMDFSSLVPHIEGALGGTAGAGETILGGFQAMVFQLLNAFGVEPTKSPFKLISAAMGVGGVPLTSLVSGTSAFTKLGQSITAAKTLSGSGHNVQMPVSLFLQGESGPSDSTFTPLLVQLAADVDAQARGILTQQTDAVVMLTYQLNIPVMASKYTEAQRLSPLIRIAAPMYQVEISGYRGAPVYDVVHKSAPGYRILGANFAVAWFSQVILKRPWRPLQLSLDARGQLRCHVDGNDLIVYYDVPWGGQLAFDDGLYPNPQVSPLGQRWSTPQKGFYLFNSSGAEKVVGVKLEGRNAVRLVGANPAAGDILRVGYKDPTVTASYSAFTNLRDCQGDIIKFDDAGGWPVHNWAILQEHTLTSAELAR